MAVATDTLLSEVEAVAPIVRDVAAKIHANPELRFEEHQAAGWIAEALELAGHRVDRGLGGMSTALRATAGKAGGPRVAILAEYDALPEIGHACGHNLIAGGALGAFLALAKRASELPGEVVLLGTPAEEGGGGKIKLIEAGAFAGIDAAMMFHPFDRDLLAHPTLANAYVTFNFKGRASHAALAPWEGASALTACLQTFKLIDSQRVHFKDGDRVHGYVTHGGEAVNIIPERAACEFSVRAFEAEELDRVLGIVQRCAKGAAIASDVEVEIDVRKGYRDMRNNLALARRFGKHLEHLGRKPRELDPTVGTGSTDMGDVSHVVPSIHPWLAICKQGETTCHQREFAACAGSERGFAAMVDAAKALALLARDVLEDGELRAAAKREHEAS
ncbi:MAG: M20 family metallopeptidase [Polyangiaceae bacterium]|nr:M20 family metallopeptidase [Polyangiaceae bacterium]